MPPFGGTGIPYTAQLVFDALSTAEGRLEDMRRNALARPQRSPKPLRRRHDARRFTLFGHIKALPAAVSFIAGFGTAVLVIAGVLRLIGVY